MLSCQILHLADSGHPAPDVRVAVQDACSGNTALLAVQSCCSAMHLIQLVYLPLSAAESLKANQANQVGFWFPCWTCSCFVLPSTER